MALACALAGVTALFELAARRGPPLVDAANGFGADLAGECRAAGRGMVGAAHAQQAVIHLHRKAGGHAAAQVFAFVHGEVDAEAGAARAAGGAGAHWCTFGSASGASLLGVARAGAALMRSGGWRALVRGTAAP